ncbi:TPA: hypothetical protein I1462_001646 [Staphylococcus pseudintermedius]|uniref:Uncharacterized protein n=1 Tax=Staphylococcus pseudintermedius TaxID=283734 RepID=A0A317Z5K3_STAPS|nr:hypothetical protein [Staphylococcus pseudintermedius]ANQ88460.1 hypothetical protein A9I65_07470 [Staphylococcus pseudintermedius]AYG56780.1 hypothetical protein D8L98_10280 [Staphylococcus pseudintermedius]EGQ0366365.1 hypothetical protein [Staphylococcus pseudintermedius]EGQ2704822.1 hypothetical protein [Staphylococcus pseudintermedius]EGQ2807089.1 hypothetical protein [Staphylococcus pseudintermedius]
MITDEGELSEVLKADRINRIIDVLIQVDSFKFVKISQQHPFQQQHESDIRINNQRPVYQFSDIEKVFSTDTCIKHKKHHCFQRT